MIVYEFKAKGKLEQYLAIDEAIRTSQFIQNKCLRYWMDNRGVGGYDLNKYCKVLAEEFPFVKELNSQARQSAAERSWSAISRFYDNCQKQISGKKGYPRDAFGGTFGVKKHSRSVEYKITEWKLLDSKHIKFTDQKGIGKLKLIGTWDLAFYSEDKIKRVRLVRRADGYYVQFCIKVDVTIETEQTNKTVGIDLGLKYFIADSNGDVVELPQFYRKAEEQLNRANRQKSKKYRRGVKPQSNNYHQARNRSARKHLKVSRQRKEYCKRVAHCVIQSNDLVA